MSDGQHLMTGLDVLIVTGLQMEFEAARQVATSKRPGTRGVLSWEDKDKETATPYVRGEYITSDGASMHVALARPTRMGSTSTAFLAATLVERIRPRCLAMCGACAGNPSSVSLGDVIIAELAYIYDEGKRLAEGFESDHRQIPPHDDAWLRAFQELRPDGLPSHGTASKRNANSWLLERLYVGGTPPLEHPARARYFPGVTWSRRITELAAEGFIATKDGDLQLTEPGRKAVAASLLHEVDVPRKLPFAIKVGPMASGNAVVKDGLTWESLKRFGVRTVVGLEMEAASLATMARLGRTPWIVVKGVMDYADPAKDDRYKPFAARASAEVLFRFLEQKFARAVAAEVKQPPGKQVPQAETDDAASRCFVAMIRALFDAQYYDPGNSTEIPLYRANIFIADPVLDKFRYDLPPSASLEQVAKRMVRDGLIQEALAHLTKKVRDDWDGLRPYAKLALLGLAERYPLAGLDNLPALTAGELEVAGIKWFIADALFQEEWDAWLARTAASGLDIKNRTVAWTDMAADVKHYCDDFNALIKLRVANISLLQLSTSRNSLQDLRGFIIERANSTYLKVINSANAICLSYPDPGKAMQLVSQPMQEAVKPLLDNPLSVIPPIEWRMKLKAHLE